MRESEFKAGWGLLKAMLGFEVPAVTEKAYQSVLSDMPDGSFLRGVESLVRSPDFGQVYVQFRRLPSLDELREECLAHADTRTPVVAINGECMSLSDYLERVFSGDLPADDALVQMPLIGPGNTGHAALLKLVPELELERARSVFAGIGKLARCLTMPDAGSLEPVVVVATDERLEELWRQAEQIMEQEIGEKESV